jgi:hypothetical protein
MTPITIGDVFHEERTLAVRDPLFRELDALMDSDDVHSIDLAN